MGVEKANKACLLSPFIKDMTENIRHDNFNKQNICFDEIKSR